MEKSLPRWEQKLDSYTKALRRLAQIVNESKKRTLNDFERDGMVQRFEFTHEVAWKLMKSYAEFQGSDDVSGSRDASRWAYENGLIKKGDVWMNMIRSRNEKSHTYDGEVADEAINRIVNEYYPSMLEFQQKMAYISTSTPKDLFNQD